MENTNNQGFKLKNIVTTSIETNKENCYSLINEYIVGFNDTLELMEKEISEDIEKIKDSEEFDSVKSSLIKEEELKIDTFDKVHSELNKLIKNLKNEQYKDYFVTQILYTSSLLQVAAQLILQVDIVLNKPNLQSTASLQPFIKEFNLISKNDDIHTVLMKEYYFSQISTVAFLENEDFISQYPMIRYIEGEDDQITNAKTLMRIQFETLFNYFVKDLAANYRTSKAKILKDHNLL